MPVSGAVVCGGTVSRTRVNDIPLVQRSQGPQDAPEDELGLFDTNVLLSKVKQVMREILENKYSTMRHAVERLPNAWAVLYLVVDRHPLIEALWYLLQDEFLVIVPIRMPRMVSTLLNRRLNADVLCEVNPTVWDVPVLKHIFDRIPAT